jgi:hypothetical protein
LVLVFEFRASGLLDRYFTAWATPPIHFALVIFEIKSHKLFAQASLLNLCPPDLSLLSS